MNTATKKKQNHSTDDVELTGILAEFREALQDEIQKIEKSGQSSILLRNGRLAEQNGNDFWYTFQVDYLPSMPPDTPCNLIIGKDEYNVVIVANNNESEITLASSVKLPDTIAQARLENGATVLMERLIKRIEDNAIKVNPAGMRMLPARYDGNKDGFNTIEPNFEPNSSEEFKQLNKGQEAAVLSSLQNDITYIWGPPGTGKTTVIAEIIYQLFQKNRNVLIVSHTNTAVDGAIEKIEKRLKANNEFLHIDSSCPVLRIGTPTPAKKLSDDVLLKSHIDKLGKELIERQNELKAQYDEKNNRKSQITLLLSKFNWFNRQRIDRLALAIQLYEAKKTDCEAAHTEYEKSFKMLSQHKNENPELEKFEDYNHTQKELVKAIDSLKAELASTDTQTAQLTNDIQTAQDEIAKHTVYSDLNKKLSDMLTESFLENKLSEINSTTTSIIEEKAKLIERKKALEKKIAQKGSFTALFSRRAISQAETELPLLTDEIKQLESNITEQELTKQSYEQQLFAVRSIKKQIADVTPSQTKEHWENTLHTLHDTLSTYRKHKTELEKQLSQKSDTLKDIIKLIAELQPKNKELFRLESETAEKEKAYIELKNVVAKQETICEVLAENERQKITFLVIPKDEKSISDRFIILQELRNKITKELENENEKNLHTEIDSLQTEINKITEEQKAIAEKINQLEKEAIQKARIVGATLAKSYLSDILQECEFDTIILDEASMAPIPALWCASYLAKRNIIIVGDFLQLPPIVMSETEMARKWLGSDIFFQSGMQEKAKNPETKPDNFIMLNDQFRMEEEIADIANLYYGNYGGLKSDDLKKSPKRNDDREKFHAWYPQRGEKERSVELIDTSNLHAWVTTIPQGKSHSRLNCFSAALDVEMAFQMLSHDICEMQETKSSAKEPKVLIVAPYKPHIDRINKLIEFQNKELGLPEDPNLIKAGTIHSFQGNEADIVIFDFVVDEPHWKANLFMTDEDMNDNLRKLFNVAVTRAKFKLFIVGNIKYLRARAKNNALSELLDYLVDQEKFNIIDAKNAFPNLTYTKPRVSIGDFDVNSRHTICREDSFFDFFLEDLKNFKKRLILYSPFITENRISNLLPYFADKINAGKEIVVVTKALSDRGKRELSQYEKIENELSKIGVFVIHKKGMHEKLIFVDDNIVWMGSLNALSFTGETGEIMHRHHSEEIAKEYQKIFDIPAICTSVQQRDELRCPICGEEMTLNEGDKGVYWKCKAGDYARSLNQQYPHDGVLRCHCGGEYQFFMKNEPRWRCANDESHFIKMRIGDLKLPEMAKKIPTKKARHDVDHYFAQMTKEIEAKKGKTTPTVKEVSSRTAKKLQGKNTDEQTTLS